MHTWRTFNFDKNVETLDSYVTCIRQVTTLLGYGEPCIFEVFKNTLPTKLYWVLFPIDDLRQAVETAKRILTKEKIDRQLAGQSSNTPFMNIKDNYNNKKVTFNMQDELEDKIDRLTVMMSQLTMKDEGLNRQFNIRYTKVEAEANQENFTIYAIIISEVIKIGIDQITEIEEFNLVVEISMDKVEVDQGMNKITGMNIGEEILEVM